MKTSLQEKMNVLGLRYVTSRITGEPSWSYSGFKNLFGAEYLSEVCGHFATEIEKKMQEPGGDYAELKEKRKQLLQLEKECLEQEIN